MGKIFEGELDGKGLRVGIVVNRRFNSFIEMVNVLREIV